LFGFFQQKRVKNEFILLWRRLEQCLISAIRQIVLIYFTLLLFGLWVILKCAHQEKSKKIGLSVVRTQSLVEMKGSLRLVLLVAEVYEMFTSLTHNKLSYVDWHRLNLILVSQNLTYRKTISRWFQQNPTRFYGQNVSNGLMPNHRHAEPWSIRSKLGFRKQSEINTKIQNINFV
jgi:hypothetical protein